MAAEKRPEVTALPVLGGGSHDRVDVVAASSSQPQPGASQTVEDGLFGPSEPSPLVEHTNDPRRRSLLDGFSVEPSSWLRDTDGTSSRHGSGSSEGVQPAPLAPANTLGSGATSKSTATAVEEPPQENLDAVGIRDRNDNPDPRRGVSALLNMAADRRIIYETPLMSCEKPRWHWRGHHRTALAWTTLNRQIRDELQHEFAGLRGLSTRTGLTGSQRQQLEGFVKKYAFVDTGGSRVHIYKIASHINHACGRCANAKAWADSDRPNYISVTLLRPVSAGEEILINYEKGHTPCFVCGTRWRYKASENQRRDTPVNPPQQNPPQQPQEIQQHPVQGQQQPPEDHQQQSQEDQQQPAEDQQQRPPQGQQHPQTRGQRFRQRIRSAVRWLLGPDETMNVQCRLGDVGI